jgi:hypothetical protein
MPFLFNLPIYSKFQYTKDLIKIDNCEEWYLYSFGPLARDQQSKDFFGFNDGLVNGNSSGILKEQSNVIQSKCNNINRNSPYFKILLFKIFKMKSFYLFLFLYYSRWDRKISQRIYSIE